MRLARGDELGAEQDAQQGWELARPVADPQIVGPALEQAAFIFMSLGDEQRAQAALDELLALMRDLRQLGWVVVWAYLAAWVALGLARGSELLDVLSDEPLESGWLLATRAVAAGSVPNPA